MQRKGLLTDSNFCAAFPLYFYVFGTAKTRPYKFSRNDEIGAETFPKAD